MLYSEDLGFHTYFQLCRRLCLGPLLCGQEFFLFSSEKPSMSLLPRHPECNPATSTAVPRHLYAGCTNDPNTRGAAAFTGAIFTGPLERKEKDAEEDRALGEAHEPSSVAWIFN